VVVDNRLAVDVDPPDTVPNAKTETEMAATLEMAANLEMADSQRNQCVSTARNQVTGKKLVTDELVTMLPVMTLMEQLFTLPNHPLPKSTLLIPMGKERAPFFNRAPLSSLIRFFIRRLNDSSH
jgi:hypothetical protein